MARASKRSRARDVIRLDAFLPYRFVLLGHRLSLTNADLAAHRYPLTLQEWKVLRSSPTTDR